ncbi:MAG: hypothetical protein RJB61_2547, partial [Actinomycetota bacterium]
MLDALAVLAERLRHEGFDVSASELIDASTALCHVDIADRPLVREVLRCTMLKEADPARRFDVLFDRVFREASRAAGAQRDPSAAAGNAGPAPGGPPSSLSVPSAGQLD